MPSLWGSSKKEDPQSIQAQPTSPELLKKVETSIIKEAKQEEKNLKNVVKDLAGTQKTLEKARKAADKADSTLKQAEKNEHQTQKDLHRAEHSHERALADVKTAQKDQELRKKELEKATQALELKKSQVDTTIKEHDEHTEQRNSKLTNLRTERASTSESSGPVVEAAPGPRKGSLEPSPV